MIVKKKLQTHSIRVKVQASPPAFLPLIKFLTIHDEYYSSQVCPCCFGILKKVPNYHLRVHECQTCKRNFHRDTGSAQLMARIIWSLLDRTWSDDEANPVRPIMRRWQPPTALQDQPANIAFSSSEP